MMIETRSGNQTQVLQRYHAQRRMQHQPSPTLAQQTNQPVQPSYLLELNAQNQASTITPNNFITARRSTPRPANRLQIEGHEQAIASHDLIKPYDEHEQGKHT